MKPFKVERQYPRKWWKAWEDGSISEREFIGETERDLLWVDRRGQMFSLSKISLWGNWHPTLEEAQAAALEAEEKRSQQEFHHRARHRAIEMFQALGQVEELLCSGRYLRALEVASAALAEVRRGQ